MKRIVFCGVVLLWGLGPVDGVQAAGSAPAKQEGRRMTVTVDPRVELLSVIFRLAGNPEYNQGKVPAYVQDVDSHFGPYRDHAVVKLARRLRQKQGVSYDAVMGMAVHVTDAVALQEKIPFSPQPKTLDSRWTPESAREFLDLARQFVVDTKFADFLERHKPLYEVGVRRMQEMLDQQAREWQEKGPKIVSMIPPNGAEDVDPSLKAIVVPFDRPMKSPGWAVVTLRSPSEVPKSAGQAGYDAQRKVFTMPVELQPEKEYYFGLNAEGYLGFQSADGIPLAPVVVRFKTGRVNANSQ